jgi:MFS family permease
MGDAIPSCAPAAPLPSESHPSGSLFSLPFAFVTLATLLYFMALGALLPTLPRYVKHQLGGGGLQVGIAVGAFAVSAALLRPWVGRLGDSRGRRILVVGGSATAAISILGYTLATHLIVLVILRLMTGAGEAAMWVGAATAVQDMAPDDRRGEAASYYSAALYSGLALGPAIGERLAQTSFHAVWLFAASAAAMASLFGLRTPKGPTSTHVEPRPILHPSAVGPGLVLFFGLIPFVGFATFLPLYGDQVGLHDVGIVLFVYAALVLVVRILGARLPDRLGFQRASFIALVAVTVGTVVVGAWKSAAGVWVAAVALAAGMSLLFPALFSATVGDTPERERSHAVGTFSLFFDLANGAGPFVLGIVVSLSSERGAFLAAGAISAVGLLFLRRAVRAAAAQV